MLRRNGPERCDVCDSTEFDFHPDEGTYTCSQCFTQSRFKSQLTHEHIEGINYRNLDKVHLKPTKTPQKDVENAADAQAPWRFSELMTFILLKQVEALVTHDERLILDEAHFSRTVRTLWTWYLEGTGEVSFCQTKRDTDPEAAGSSAAATGQTKSTRQQRGEARYPLGWGLLYEPKEGRQKLPIQARKRRKRTLRYARNYKFIAVPTASAAPCPGDDMSDSFKIPPSPLRPKNVEEEREDSLDLDALKRELVAREELRELPTDNEFHARGREALAQDVESDVDLNWLGDDDNPNVLHEEDRLPVEEVFDDSVSLFTTSSTDEEDVPPEVDVVKVVEDDEKYEEEIVDTLLSPLLPDEEQQDSLSKLKNEEIPIVRELKKVRSGMCRSVFFEACVAGATDASSNFMEMNLCILYLALQLQPRRSWKLFTFSHLLDLVERHALPYFNVVGLVQRSRQFAMRDIRFQRLIMRMALPRQEKLFAVFHVLLDTFLPDSLPMPPCPLLSTAHCFIRDLHLPHEMHWIVSRAITEWWERVVICDSVTNLRLLTDKKPSEEIPEEHDGKTTFLRMETTSQFSYWSLSVKSQRPTAALVEDKEQRESNERMVRFLYPDAFILANVVMCLFYLYHLDEEYEKQVDELARVLNRHFTARLFVLEDWLEFWLEEENTTMRGGHFMEEDAAMEDVKKWMQNSTAETWKSKGNAKKFHNPGEFSVMTVIGIVERAESEVVSHMSEDCRQKEGRERRAAMAQSEFVESRLPFTKTWVEEVRRALENCSESQFMSSQADLFQEVSPLTEFTTLMQQLQDVTMSQVDVVPLLPTRMRRVVKTHLSPSLLTLLQVVAHKFHVDLDILYNACTIVEELMLYQEKRTTRTVLTKHISKDHWKRWFTLT